MPVDVIAKQSRYPETVRYAAMFHQVAAFKDLADAADNQGKDGSPYRHHLSHKFGLTPQQLIYLDLVALEFREDEKEVNEEIKQSILRFRNLNGQLPRGATALDPPSEAAYLIAKRDAITVRARERLRSLVGNEEFGRIDGLVKKTVDVTEEGSHER